MYLKNDMKSKMNLPNDLEVAVGFTSTMMVQHTYSRTHIIVLTTQTRPAVIYLQTCEHCHRLNNNAACRAPRLFSDQTVSDTKRYFQGGSVAAYQHVAMLKLHYKIAHPLDECLPTLEELDELPQDPPRRVHAVSSVVSDEFSNESEDEMRRRATCTS